MDGIIIVIVIYFRKAEKADFEIYIVYGRILSHESLKYSVLNPPPTK